MHSVMQRRLGWLGLISAGALIAALSAHEAQAQYQMRSTTQADDDDNARGRRPPPRRNARRPRGSGYGVPPGSGAGRTGFDSTNTGLPAATSSGGAITPPASLNAGATPPVRRPRVAPAPSPGSRDLRLPRRVGNEQPQLARPGASPAPGTATPLIRARRASTEEDPFEAVGIRVGSFTLRPALEMTTGIDSNPSRAPGGKSAWMYTVSPELLLRSNWSRHALNADIKGSYIEYLGQPTLNRPTLDARVQGRVDISRNTRADIEGRVLVATDYPNSPDLPPGQLSRLPLRTTFGGDVGLTHRFNRFEVGAKATVERTVWGETKFANAASVGNDDRNYDQFGLTLRAAYELTPAVKPFAEVSVDKRVRDLEVDSFGLRRSSDGVTGRLGSTFEISRQLTGEVAVGYLSRTYKDDTLPELRGVIADASLIWSPTGLTTVKVTAKSTADETTLIGVSGVLRRDVGVQVDHAFRRWLIGTVRFGYGLDDYDGSLRKDTRYLASLGLTYKMTRTVQLKGELRQEWMTSTIAGVDYTATVALVGLRLQR